MMCGWRAYMARSERRSARRPRWPRRAVAMRIAIVRNGAWRRLPSLTPRCRIADPGVRIRPDHAGSALCALWSALVDVRRDVVLVLRQSGDARAARARETAPPAHACGA